MFTTLGLATLMLLLLFVLGLKCRTRVKLIAIGMAIAGCIAMYGLHDTLPATPKSVLIETADVKVAKVLWSASDDDRIYLLLTWPEIDEPRYYWMPATKKRQRQLRQARQQARARRQPLMVREPFKSFRTDAKPGTGKKGKGKGKNARGLKSRDNDGKNENIFYAPPPRPLPPKR